MFSLHAFNQSTASTSAATAISALADPIAAVSTTFLYVPILNNLIGGAAIGAAVQTAEIRTPSLLAFVPFDISPVDPTAVPQAVPRISLQPASPFKLVTDEPMQAFIQHANTESDTVLVFLSDGPVAPVSGVIIRARFTFTAPATANAWINGALTAANQLAEGNYQVVGGRAESPDLIAWRLVFPGGATTVRPGTLGANSFSVLDVPVMRNGGMGVWGTFSNRVLPTIDMIARNTVAAPGVLILDLIKTG